MFLRVSINLCFLCTTLSCTRHLPYTYRRFGIQSDLHVRKLGFGVYAHNFPQIYESSTSTIWIRSQDLGLAVLYTARAGSNGVKHGITPRTCIPYRYLIPIARDSGCAARTCIPHLIPIARGCAAPLGIDNMRCGIILLVITYMHIHCACQDVILLTLYDSLVHPGVIFVVLAKAVQLL